MRIDFPPGTRFSAWSDGMGCVTVSSDSTQVDMLLRRTLSKPPTYLDENKLGVWYVPREQMPKGWVMAAKKAKAKGWLRLRLDGGLEPA